MDDLIARLEQATGADRELDAVIACHVKFEDSRPARPDDFGGKYGYCAGNIKVEHGFLQADHYTADINAALTLVPEGWGGSIHFSEDRPDCELHCTVALGRSYPTNADAYAEKSGKDATRESIALAICIAALRARRGDRD